MQLQIRFYLLSFFLSNQKQESGFQQVGGLVTRNISVFLYYSESRSTSKACRIQNFYKGIFLHVTPVRIIVP